MFTFYLRTPFAKIWITVSLLQKLCRSPFAFDFILYAEEFFVLSNFLLVMLRRLESGKQANEVFFGCLRNLSLIFGEFVYRPCFNKLSAKIVSLLGLGH